METMSSNVSILQFPFLQSYIDGLFLMRSPFPLLAIWVSYMFFVLKCGPKFMEKRKPYNLRNVLLVYNAFQVALSCYLCKIGLDGVLEHGIVESSYCFVQLSDDIRKQLFFGCHVYLLAKATELLDTVFFVLRKKWDQITFLHVYHHSIMYLGTWLFFKYDPSYTFAFLGTLNSFVHAVMYTYYGLAAFPSLAKHLWWKKYITKMQLIQFIVVLMQILWNYLVSSCPASYSFLVAALINFVLFMYLFLDFYFRRYINRKERKEDELRKEQ